MSYNSLDHRKLGEIVGSIALVLSILGVCVLVIISV